MHRAYQVTTIAGNGQAGFKDGNALEAMFRNPWAICLSNNGTLYLIDSENHKIRMIYNNQVATIAGNGRKGFKDGNALEAMFNYPQGICVSNSHRIYVSDSGNNRIRVIYNNQVTTIAGNGQKGFKDGNALEAMFNYPSGICISNDNKLYVADAFNHRIRMIYNGQVTTIPENAQDGNALESMFSHPNAICISNDGRLYVVDSNRYRVRMIYNNQVTTIAGNGKKGYRDGNALQAMFDSPWSICISKDGRLYVADVNKNVIRMLHNNQVTTIAGNGEQGYKDGNALQAMFTCPHGICISNNGLLYVTGNNIIRMIYTDLHSTHKSSLFGFALLLDMQNTFCDCQISFNNITYHLHSKLINVRCPLLLDQSYFSLLQQSNISNESFDSFVTFLYTNKFTKEQHQTWQRTISIKSIVELTFLFELLMNYKSILTKLKTIFGEQLIETLKINQQESTRSLVDLLPCFYKFKELIKTRPVESTDVATTTTTNASYTEYCYNLIVHELQQRRSLLAQYLPSLQLNCPNNEVFMILVQNLVSEATKIEPQHQSIKALESMIDFGFELTEFSKLAFQKTNIPHIDENSKETVSKSTTISTQHLDAWTRPDFVIKLSNDDDDNISYDVHKIVLCGRWKYFCQMIESGMKESQDNEMTLSDDWNKSRFEKMMKYIYLNEIEFESFEDIAWLIRNGKVYGTTVDKNKDLSTLNQNDQIAAYGFEALHDHCISFLNQPLKLSNCVSMYKMFQDIGKEPLVQQAFEFIIQNFWLLMKKDTTREEIRKAFNAESIRDLLFAQYDRDAAVAPKLELN